MSIRFLKTSNYPYLYSASKNKFWLGFTYVPLRWAGYQNGQQEGAHMQSITCTVLHRASQLQGCLVAFYLSLYVNAI